MAFGSYLSWSKSWNFWKLWKIGVEQAKKPFSKGGRGGGGGHAAKFRKIMLFIATSPDLTKFWVWCLQIAMKNSNSYRPCMKKPNVYLIAIVHVWKNLMFTLIKFVQILGQVLGKNREKALILLRAKGKIYD